MIEKLAQLLRRISFKQILFLALILRILAVIFAKGFVFHDDHFGLVELAFYWRNGSPVSSFPDVYNGVYIFSLLYPGFLYLIFDVCNAVGINSPEGMMFVVRLLHALLSLLTVYYGYLLTMRMTSNITIAKTVALILAAFWFFPFMSVHTLREFLCVPFLFGGAYYLSNAKPTAGSVAAAAIFFIVAFCIRFQTILFPFGFALWLLFKKEYTGKMILFGLFFVVCYFLSQGLFDYLFYGNPFASIVEYFRYNSNPENIGLYPQGPWYTYIGTVAAMVLGIPFFVLALGYGYNMNKSLPQKILLFGSLLFFIFHSYYSNKQERFILPFIPFFLLLGIVGFCSYYVKHCNANWVRKFTTFTVAWFIVLNSIGLFVVTCTFSKKSRVEAMTYLRNKNDVNNIIMEANGKPPPPPLFYLGKHIDFYQFSAADSLQQFKNELEKSSDAPANYIIMVGDDNFEQRLQRMQILFPKMSMETVITPSFVDGIAHRLNPSQNENESWRIYRIK